MQNGFVVIRCMSAKEKDNLLNVYWLKKVRELRTFFYSNSPNQRFFASTQIHLSALLSRK